METTVQRVVTLGNGKQIPLGRYETGIHDAIRHPDRTYRHGLCGWAPVTGREVLGSYPAVLEAYGQEGAGQGPAGLA